MAMGGVHGMGGVAGYGPVEPERDEVVFHDDRSRAIVASMPDTVRANLNLTVIAMAERAADFIRES